MDFNFSEEINTGITSGDGKGAGLRTNMRKLIDNDNFLKQEVSTVFQEQLELKEEIKGISGGFKKALFITDIPTEDGIYPPAESGVFPNAGGLTYYPEGVDKGYKVTFIKSGAEWFKDRVDLGIELAQVVAPDETTKAISSSGAFNAINNDSFVDTSVSHPLLARFLSKITIFIDKDDSLPISAWLSTSSTSTVTTIYFYRFPGGIRTIVGTCNIDFNQKKDNINKFNIKDSSGRSVGYLYAKKEILPLLVGVNITDRSKNVLKRTAYNDSKKSISELRTNVLHEGSFNRFAQINFIVKDFLIGSKGAVKNPRFNRLTINGYTRSISVIYENELDETVNIAYNSSDVISNLDNERILISDSSGFCWFFASVDWTKASEGTLTFTAIAQAGEPSGSSTYELTGINQRLIIEGKKNEFYKNVLNLETTNGINGTGSIPLSEIMVLSEDAPAWLKIWVGTDYPEEAYIISSNEDEVNVFLDTFIDKKETTIQFIGTFVLKSGLRKHPNLNFLGYGAELKMADEANAEYKQAIEVTSGGKTFAESQEISHNNTFIKGFELDGNFSGSTSYNSLYGRGIGHTIFNDDLIGFSDVQYVTDVVVKDLSFKNFKRSSLIPGERWTGSNLSFDGSQFDHGLYVAGSGNVWLDNIKMKGNFVNGAISIAGNNKLYQRFKSDNIRLRNVLLDECQGGPHIDIRGQFDNTLYPCNNVIIDGLRINNRNAPYGNFVFTLGSVNETEPTPTDYSGFSKGIEIKNLYVDMNLNSIMFAINRAQVKLSGKVIISKNRNDRPMFRLSGVGESLYNQLDFSGLDIIIDENSSQGRYPIVGLYNNTTPVLPINGMKLDGLSIKSMTDNNFMLFDLNDSASDNFEVKNLSMNNLIANTDQSVNPDVASKISFTESNKLIQL